jgi:hypothetical protein
MERIILKTQKLDGYLKKGKTKYYCSEWGENETNNLVLKTVLVQITVEALLS